jgi:type II secretory pathway pseudopilin PulG
MNINDTTSQVESRKSKAFCFRSPALDRRPVSAFTMVEVMVVVVLMSFIVLALMSVFSTTQRAFRASITQTDVLEGGRSAMDMIAADVRLMAPGYGASNNAVNFCVTNYADSILLTNTLVGSIDPRTNVLESLFILTRGIENGQPVWSAVCYAVVPNSVDGLYSLYRFSTNHHEMAYPPAFLFTNDFLRVFYLAPTNGSHLIDGVVHLTAHAFDTNGTLIQFNQKNIRTNGLFYMSHSGVPFGDRGDIGYNFYSNAIPAAVEIELGVLEDRTLQRARTLHGGVLDSYLGTQGGKVHVFRQRIWIPSMDPSVY